MNLRHITTSRGISTLESMDASERRVLPARSVRRGNGDTCEVDDVEWERGILLDLDIQTVTISADIIKTALHKHGLWTNADIQRDMRKAKTAMSDATMSAFVAMLAQINSQ